MASLAEPLYSPRLDLDIIEADLTPIFVTKISSKALDYDILFGNEAFRTSSLQSSVLAKNRTALLFRSWTQALGDFRSRYEFAERIWSAEMIAGITGTWKLIKVAKHISKDEDVTANKVIKQIGLEDASLITERSPTYKRTKQELMEDLRRDRTLLLRNIPRTNLSARWESIQTMMEMSDVGVFEYSSEGKLIHANEAWYRLSSHPKDLPSHVDFSFMDLVYPGDQAIVMSMWNALAEGHPVTFEMRWKPRAGTNDSAQWVLSACVPVLDDEGNLISIAGNTIDINAQKKSQEAAQAQVEALERARLSELKFARFAQLSPTAIYIFVPNNGMKFVNDQFFELTGCSHAPADQSEWFEIMADEDVDRVKEDWCSILDGKKSNGVQFRLKKQWTNQDDIRSNIWVQSSSYPELDESGKVISIMGTLFDISQFKWAESVQRRRIEEALEAKRQQENFIDMTSHELRNPLSAVIQCADSVIASLQQITSPQLAISQLDIDDFKMQAEVEACIDSLQTIISCSLHQKRVIDDVLTLSKLDSNLILITPVRVQPAVVIADALKMFDLECSQSDIGLDFREEGAFEGMEWVMLDPSRLLQILINLLTNAIKFTKDRSKRKIGVTLKRSWHRPISKWRDIAFTTGDGPRHNILDKAEWGEGRKCYLWIKVADTGCGMSQDEQKKLFSRFSQTTPRTHVKYGGSGLGLFISKSLSALQGGAIGVHSEQDVGSTFAFYISARLADPPAGQEAGTAGKGRPMLERTMSIEDAMKKVKLNVLIVEDNLVNQKVLAKQLQKFGWTISVAGNGKEALEWLQGSVYWRAEGETRHDSGINDGIAANKKPAETLHDLDIILLDIEMPIMDGLECARMIRDYEAQGLLAPPPRPPSTPNRQPSASSLSPISSFHKLSASKELCMKRNTRLPILAVSANARMEQIGQALAAGMDDAISKPFRIPELWPKMRGLVKRIAEEAVDV
ncbi:Nn.00g022020.m01.CDS01 [Neocucurbitaria sp. VM-36]